MNTEKPQPWQGEQIDLFDQVEAEKTPSYEELVLQFRTQIIDHDPKQYGLNDPAAIIDFLDQQKNSSRFETMATLAKLAEKIEADSADSVIKHDWQRRADLK